ncbi:MAG TPA: hypothetical protein VFQ59_00305 [Candidatus Paceibacterota bacterium]|nr:hypothetical protein [Candidatus Paceibacterota bacterium]
MFRLNRENVLSLFLAFVVIWFGVNEFTNPASWTAFIPQFLNVSGEMARYMVMAHGAILVLAGLALVFDWKRRSAAFVIFIMILSIVATIIMGEGLGEIAVRDIGLLGMALALSLRS